MEILVKRTLSIAVCATVLNLLSIERAQSDEPTSPSPLTFTVGVKAWVNTWTSWQISRVQSGGNSLQAITPITSDQQVAYTPFLGLRHQRMFFSASAMTDTDYTLSSSTTIRTGTRSERDLNVGYDVLPGLALTVGEKQLTQNVGGEYKWSGPTLGASVSAPLQSGLNVYGAFGVGRMKVKLPSADAAGNTSLNADYTLSEFGLAYSLGRDQPNNTALTVTLGYRAQTVRTRDYMLSSQPSGTVYGKDDLRDSTQGLAFSIIGSF